MENTVKISWLRLVALTTVLLLSESVQAKSYPGPLAIPWGTEPELAKTLISKRFEFVREWDGPGEELYVTQEQLYRGIFGGLPASDVQLKFYDRKFFYLTVILEPLAKASRIFEEVVKKMEKAYGPPTKITRPEKLFSQGVNLVEYPIESPYKDKIVNMFLQADVGKGPSRYDLLDTLIRMGHWDPTATWKFKNKVTIQTFVLPERDEATDQIKLVNYWIFSKDNKREAWFESRMNPPKIRDY